MLNHLDSALSPEGLALFLHGAVEPWLLQRATSRFHNEGDDAVGKWAPLQPSTMEFRENDGHGASHPINKRTGELENYITGVGADTTSLPGLATLTFPDPDTKMSPALQQKMKTAQEGRSNPRTVARPVLGLGEKDLVTVLTQLAFHVREWKGFAGK